MASGCLESGAQLSLQPETRPISQEQLTLEVKNTYAGLVMVEAKCIEVNEKQSISTQAVTPRPECNTDEQWQNIPALHRTSFHEVDEHLMVFQHPSTTRALYMSKFKYTMSARMWRQNVHSFLELLQHWLLKSHEKILTLVHVAYIMMTLFLGRLPTFRSIRTECFGNIDRQVAQYSIIFATSWTYLVSVLEAGLVLPTLLWTYTRLWVIEDDPTESYVFANAVDPSIGCLCAQCAPCAVDDESEDDHTLTVAPTDRNCVWPASPPIRAGLMPSFLCLFASALSGSRSRVLHWTVLFASFSRPILGMPAPTNGSAKESTRLSAPTDILADLAVVVLVVIVLVIAHLLIALKVKPPHVWATLMACSAFGWWCIRSDMNASLVLSCA
ncbi:MAG: hypothetical protein Q9212_003446 [Teloschistes hypoglaucus]